MDATVWVIAAVYPALRGRFNYVAGKKGQENTPSYYLALNRGRPETSASSQHIEFNQLNEESDDANRR
jgi:hypothetical protein